ncbi:hypothetical protein PVAND_009414 [Polypedilum vanderplanki]|uniref:Gustatory receptor n=1 Tax=Polypedilum vanderplanki TaxID=319348 RepID=A0A9J6CD69_POLVA|nr:hypothetical protein PVAND_009414 [Polypedilum vanderplanki]
MKATSLKNSVYLKIFWFLGLHFYEASKFSTKIEKFLSFWPYCVFVIDLIIFGFIFPHFPFDVEKLRIWENLAFAIVSYSLFSIAFIYVILIFIFRNKEKKFWKTLEEIDANLSFLSNQKANYDENRLKFLIFISIFSASIIFEVVDVLNLAIMSKQYYLISTRFTYFKMQISWLKFFFCVHCIDIRLRKIEENVLKNLNSDTDFLLLMKIYSKFWKSIKILDKNCGYQMTLFGFSLTGLYIFCGFLIASTIATDRFDLTNNLYKTAIPILYSYLICRKCQTCIGIVS